MRPAVASTHPPRGEAPHRRIHVTLSRRGSQEELVSRPRPRRLRYCTRGVRWSPAGGSVGQAMDRPGAGVGRRRRSLRAPTPAPSRSRDDGASALLPERGCPVRPPGTRCRTGTADTGAGGTGAPGGFPARGPRLPLAERARPRRRNGGRVPTLVPHGRRPPQHARPALPDGGELPPEPCADRSRGVFQGDRLHGLIVTPPHLA